MADKSFGVKDLNIVGASGDPTIESNGDLNLKAGQVAIQTNTTVTGVVTATAFVGNGAGLTNLPGGGSYGNSDVDTHLNTGSASSGEILSWNGSDYDWVADQTGGGGVPANLTATTLNVSGITTAGSFVTNLIDGSGTSRGFCTRYYITSNGASDYRFAGPGQRNSVGNPTLYLMRGFTYMFENSTGGSHPFRIQFTNTSTGVGTYVSGSQTGVQIFTIPHDAPSSYQYQCTAHGGMIGSFIIPS